MKKFLNDLRKELKKQGINEYEINEIIQDHQEMIGEAQLGGLSDEDIVNKFGNPSKLAQELGKGTKTETSKKDGYKLHKSYDFSKLLSVKIILVADDLIYEEHDSNDIEIYFKRIKNPEDYKVSYKGYNLVIEMTKSMTGWFNSKSGKILVKVPRGVELSDYKVTTVSGDMKISSVLVENGLIKSTSGDMKLSNFKAEELKITTVSGDGILNTIETVNAEIGSVSGDYKIQDVDVKGRLDLNAVSGDFSISDSSSKSAYVNTVSGDLRGKNFYPVDVSLKSVSGDIIIKNDDSSREINVLKKKTLSGDIKIK